MSEPTLPTEHEIRMRGRQGGNAAAMRAEVEKRLREGWVEVTAEPEYALRVEGVRLFKRPAAPTEDATP